jgi:hypothetical protein
MLFGVQASNDPRRSTHDRLRAMDPVARVEPALAGDDALTR